MTATEPCVMHSEESDPASWQAITPGVVSKTMCQGLPGAAAPLTTPMMQLAGKPASFLLPEGEAALLRVFSNVRKPKRFS